MYFFRKWFYGPNIFGKMVDDEGNEIDLVKYLNQNHVTNPLEPKHEYLAYRYEEQAKNDSSKTYKTIFPRLVPNTTNGRKDLEGYINFMKSKGFIKEVVQGTNVTSDVVTDSAVPDSF